jgi:hypothetical protein
MPASTLYPGAPTAGGSYGGAPSGGGSYTQDVQANPYLDKAFSYFGDLWNRSKDLYGQALDPTPAVQQFQDTRAQGLKDVQAMSGQRGFGPGTGMLASQLGDYATQSLRGEQGLAADWRNKGLQFQQGLLGQMTGILGGMGGVGQNIAGNQLGLGQLGVEQAKLGADTWYKQQELELRKQQIAADMQAKALAATAGSL